MKFILKLLGSAGVYCEWRKGHFYIFQNSVHVPAAMTMAEIIDSVLWKRVGPTHQIHLCWTHFEEGNRNWKEAVRIGYRAPEELGGRRHTHPPGSEGVGACLRLNDDVADIDRDQKRSGSNQDHDDTSGDKDTP